MAKRVISVVDSELANRASLNQALALPAHSLLGMIVSPIAKQPGYEDPVESELTSIEQAAADQHDYTIKQIAMAIDASCRKVIFKHGIEFGGSAYELIAALNHEFEDDLDAGTFRDQYRFVKANALAKRLGTDEQSLRQRVSQARKKIEQAFLTAFDQQLDPDDVIKTRSGRAIG